MRVSRVEGSVRRVSMLFFTGILVARACLRLKGSPGFGLK